MSSLYQAGHTPEAVHGAQQPKWLCFQTHAHARPRPVRFVCVFVHKLRCSLRSVADEKGMPVEK